MIQLSFAFFFLLFWMLDMKSIVINKEKGLRIYDAKQERIKINSVVEKIGCSVDVTLN
jgi:hypothetical protein